MIGLAPGANASPIGNYNLQLIPDSKRSTSRADNPRTTSGYDFTKWNNCAGGGQKLLVHVRQFPDIERRIPAGIAEHVGGAVEGAGTISGVEIIGGC